MDIFPEDQYEPNAAATLSRVPCTVCGRSFNSKRGLGVHMRSRHPDELDEERRRVDIKARWSDEEKWMMARKEVELTANGCKHINKQLAVYFANRSVEAIKKLRQRGDYKEKIEQIRGQSALAPEVANLTIRRRPSRSEQDHQVTTSETTPITPFEQSNREILRTLRGYSPVECHSEWRAQELQTIIDRAHLEGKETTLQCLSLYLLGIFPAQGVRHTLTRPPRRPRNRRESRRQQYAVVQRNWDKHKGRCIKSLLNGTDESVMPSQEIMVPYWREVMTQPSPSSCSGEVIQMDHSLERVWSAITEQDLRASRVSLSSSPGPDGITPKSAREVPSGIMLRIMNLILWCGNLPHSIRLARTVFIPKTVTAKRPQDFRPISVPSVLVRQLNAILATRLNSSINWDPRQRGFLPTDGCADNATIVDLVLRHSHKHFRSCYIANLDVSKAFDSLSHASIYDTLRAYGAPKGFVDYVQNTYEGGGTSLNGDGWSSEEFVPARGVKQGDPLSPILFNLVMDRLLRTLPSEIGAKVGNAITNAAAFADDLVLFAETRMGLQVLLDKTLDFLSIVGLKLNADKCFTVGIKGQPKQKCTVLEAQSFYVGSSEIPSLKRTDEWKYLGINFTATGRVRCNPAEDIGPKLQRLTKAPLKPQQRLFALRTVLIPQLYHKLALGSVAIGVLRKTDKLIRYYVRRWLNLPLDVPIAFVHAPPKSGGLGIPSLRWVAPMLRLRRLSNIKWPHLTQNEVASSFLEAEKQRARDRLLAEQNELLSRPAIEKYWANKLYLSVDGSGLREAGHYGPQHGWVSQPTRLLTGKEYIDGIRLRINALPTKSRTTRGRHELERQCRAGCDAPETTNHIMQKCYRSHGRRVARHNCVVNRIKRGLEERGCVVIVEPSLQCESGLNKPDLVALRQNHIDVIDIQIVTDGHSMDDAHQRKINRYDRPDIRTELRRRFEAAGDIEFHSATLNWRGIWSGQSVKRLIAKGLLSKYDSHIISVQVMRGSLGCFKQFMYLSGFSRDWT